MKKIRIILFLIILITTVMHCSCKDVEGTRCTTTPNENPDGSMSTPSPSTTAEQIKTETEFIMATTSTVPITTTETAETTAASSSTTTKKTTLPPSTTRPTTSTMLSKINPKDYNEYISYSNFTETDKKLINDIFALYNTNKNQEKAEKQLDYTVSIESYYRVTSFFFIYYGRYKEIADIMFDITTRTTNEGEEVTLTVHPPIISEIEKERKENTKIITEKISKINEGTEKEKIRQIIDIIAKETKYEEEARTVKDILRYSRGNCNAYTLLFARYCQLLDIQCDICIGTAPSGKHAWNKVTYKDGTTEYFDITFYDTGKSNRQKYIFMKNSHFDVEYINFYYSSYFEGGS